MAQKPEGYKTQPIRSSVLRAVLVLEIAACCIVFAAFVTGSFSVTGRLVIPPQWFGPYNTVAKSLSYMPALAFLCLLFWVFRANKNARALSPQTLEYSPAWAVGWFFVPVACLWKPYQVVREIYKASRTPHGWRSTKAATLVGWWWGLALIGYVLAVEIRIGTSSNHPIGRELALLFFGIMAVHQTLLFSIIVRIDAWQAAARRSGGIENVF